MPTSQEVLSRELCAASGLFVGAAEMLQKVTDLACAAVPVATLVGLTMIVYGRPCTAVCTDPAAREIDVAQYRTGIGPSLDAVLHVRVCRIDDMGRDWLWAPFSEAAAAHGMKSSMSLPVVARGKGVAALNFYSRSSSGFSDDDIGTGLQFAVQAGIVLATGVERFV